MTATYVGLRAATEHATTSSRVPRSALHLRRWIRSTGITGSLAIAEWVREALADSRARSGSGPESRHRMPTSASSVRVPTRRASASSATQTSAGSSVLRAGHPRRIDAALASPIPPADTDGLRRRTRALMGRCQGFFCGAEIASVGRARMSIAEGPVVMGGGPSGLAAAIELRKTRHLPGHGDRAKAGQAGGIPRHSRPHGLRRARSPHRRLRAAVCRALPGAGGGGRCRDPHRDDGHRLGGGEPPRTDRTGRAAGDRASGRDPRHRLPRAPPLGAARPRVSPGRSDDDLAPSSSSSTSRPRRSAAAP